MEKEYLNRKEASEYLSKKVLSRSFKTLGKYATIGGGPKFRKFGKRQVVYAVADLDTWIAEQLSRPFGSTSENV